MGRAGMCGALITALAIALPGRAEDSDSARGIETPVGELEFGLGYFSDELLGFGRVPGPEPDGPFSVLNIDLDWRAPYADPTARYWHFHASDLGLRSGEARFVTGVQGVSRAQLSYDELLRFGNRGGQTPMQSRQDDVLVLPASWQADDSTAGMTNLASSLRDIRMEQVRRQLAMAFSWTPTEQWKFAADFQREHKEGQRSLAALIGNSGGNPRAILLAEPVDYVTNQVELAAHYTEPDWQVRLGWSLSLFDNEHTAQRWQNPYAAIAGWDPSAGYPDGEGQAALPPDNSFQQLSFSAGYQLSPQTRVSADVVSGTMRQDEDFLPYTVNPVLAASISEPLPISSLNGVIDLTTVNVRLSSRPDPLLQYTLSYRYDDRDSNGDGTSFVYIPGDSQTQDTDADSSRRRIRQAYDYTEQTARLEAGYRPYDTGHYRASVQHRQQQRSASERAETREDQLTVAYQHQWAAALTGDIRLSRAERDGDIYIGNEPLLSSYAPGYTETVAGSWDNHPDLRRYYLADRRRDEGAAQLNWAPSESWQVGISARAAADDYRHSEMGLTETDLDSLSIDGSYTVGRDWTVYGFYSRDELRAQQDGRSFSGTDRINQAADPSRDWRARHQDRSDAVGAGFAHELLTLPMTVGADLLYSETDSEVAVSSGTALTTAALPTVTARLQSLSLFARYRWRSQFSFKCQYLFEDYASRDWALDGVAPNTLTSVLLLGEDSPNYRSHGILLSLAYRF